MPHIVDDDDALLMDDEIEDASTEDLDFDESESFTDSEKPEKPVKPETPKKLEESEPSEPQNAGKSVGDDEEEPESYSKRVQKRISKLTGRMRELERETGFWKDKVTALEAKTQAKEFAEFQSQVEWTTQDLNRQIDQTRAEKKAAIEEGDIDKQIKLDEKMLDLREQLAEKKRIATAAKEHAAQFQESQASSKPPVSAPPSTIPDHLPTGTKQWLRANPWFMKNDDPKAAEFARLLDASLQEEGYSPDDPAMYAELDKRLHGLVPRLAKAAKPPPKPKVAGSSVDGQRSPSTTAKPQRKLTSDDLTKMKRYGFDPNKPEHRKNWLRRFDPL